MRTRMWPALGLVALLAGPVTPAGAVSRLGTLPLHENDYRAASAEARRRGLPMFVEVWAPW